MGTQAQAHSHTGAQAHRRTGAQARLLCNGSGCCCAGGMVDYGYFSPGIFYTPAGDGPRREVLCFADGE